MSSLKQWDHPFDLHSGYTHTHTHKFHIRMHQLCISRLSLSSYSLSVIVFQVSFPTRKQQDTMTHLPGPLSQWSIKCIDNLLLPSQADLSPNAKQKMPQTAHQQKHLCFSPSLPLSPLLGDLSHQGVGVERWRRGVEERRAVSCFALIIEVCDIEVYGFVCKCGHKESGAHLSAQTQFYSLNMKSGKTFTLWTDRR